MLPQAEIQGLQERMGWQLIPWYTLTDDFDADFGVDQWHGTNAFIREGDRIFRTYFVHDRGDEQVGTTWSYLDITALGRQETWEDSPEGYPQTPPYASGGTTTTPIPPLAERRRLAPRSRCAVMERRRSSCCGPNAVVGSLHRSGGYSQTGRRSSSGGSHS